MSVASELHTSLRTMGFVQLLLALAFLACYALASTMLLEGRGRLRAAVGAVLAAAAFVASMQPWVHGAMFIAIAVAGMGMFSAMVWLMSVGLRVRERVAAGAFEPATPSDVPAPALPALPAPRGGLPAA
jgi:Na+/proline symporter